MPWFSCALVSGTEIFIWDGENINNEGVCYTWGFVKGGPSLLTEGH